MRVLSKLLLVFACAVHAHGTDATPANVVLIVVDDLGYCDSELYGCDTVPTPNIKRLADEGVRFTAGYVSSPVCSPRQCQRSQWMVSLCGGRSRMMCVDPTPRLPTVR